MAEENDFWDYSPSLAVAAVASAIFGILAMVHIFRLFTTRTWFCIPLVVGALFETVGFIIRVICSKNLNNLDLFIIQYLLVLLAPILFAASVYMILGRLIRATNAEQYAILRPTRITKIFVGGDIICFLVQGAGGGVLSNATTSKSQALGQGIILGGLVLQIVIFGLFLVVAAIYHKRLRDNPTVKSLDPRTIGWESMLYQLYGVSGLITIRNVFRAVEYGGGEKGYLLTHEWPMYVFDALLMAFALAICSLWYVGSMEWRDDDIALNFAENGDSYESRPAKR